MQRSDVRVPASVPADMMDAYIDRFLRVTNGTGKLLLFAGDQKIEHLNEDYAGEGIAQDDANPEHLFKIANGSRTGVFAAQHGLISQYARDYPHINYLVKMNSRTHLVTGEPVSTALVDFEDVLSLLDNGINVVGIGYTIYVGSEHESIMFEEAGRLIAQAHEHGLLVVLWMYPRGKAIQDQKDAQLIAGAAGVGVSLGADFVKVNQPLINAYADAALIRPATFAAGRTGVLVSGGSAADPGAFLHLTWQQLQAGTRGAAVGRNIHQRPLDEAVRLANAMAALIYDGVSTHEAWLVYAGEKS